MPMGHTYDHAFDELRLICPNFNFSALAHNVIVPMKPKRKLA